MAFCYNKLWKLLIDKKMTKTQLCKQAKICATLDCTMDDIIDVIPDEKGGENNA